MRPAGSIAQAELARALSPAPETNPTVSYDVGTITSTNPLTVSVRGLSIPYAPRLQSYQRAAVGHKVFVLLIGASALILGPAWTVDNLLQIGEDCAHPSTPASPPQPPTPPPQPPPPPPPATLVTRDYPITWYTQYRGDPAWGNPTGNHLNYGYSVGYQFRSAWTVDSAAVRAAISGHKVQSVQLYLHNLNAYRGTGTQVVVVEMHTAKTAVNNWSALPGRKALAIWQFGVPPANQARWLNITSAVNLATFGGFALPDAGNTNPTSYGYVSSPLDNTLRDPPILRVAWWQ